MSVIASEIKWYKAAVMADGASNGGRMSANPIASAVKNALFPDVTDAELTAGIAARYRKAFIKIENDDDLALQSSRVRITAQSPGDDRVYIFPGTQRNTEANLTGSEDYYGTGDLDADVIAGATSLVVNLETGAGADTPFRDGATIWIGDGTNEEFRTLEDPGGVSYNVDEVTLTLASGETLDNGYLAATPTKVASVIEAGTIEATIDNVIVTSASGTFDDTDVVLDHVGGVEQTWTVTFSNATNFTVAGDTLSSIGSGDIASPFTPNNPNFSRPYFTIPTAAWGGTFATNDTVVFQTHPAAFPIWYKMEVPAGAASLGADSVEVRVKGASA